MNISYSFGMVDLLHFGHVNAIKKAATGADLKIFGLLSDEASDMWFGVHVSNEAERRAVLEGVKYIDEIWEQKAFDPIDNLRKLHAKYPKARITLYTSNEWAVISAKKYVESIGGNVVKLNYYDKLSPQSILDTLNANEPINSTKNKLISTKANTLQALKSVLTKGYIEDAYIITVGEFTSNRKSVCLRIREAYVGKKIVVRSSSKREDAFEESNAGHFTSILDVDSADESAICDAISKVIASYGDNIENDEQILIQSQTEGVLASGVVFTRDIHRNRPYYVINYDANGSTDSVTSGIGGTSVWISRFASQNEVPAKWKDLMEAVWELENILTGVILDIEFAITGKEVVIFQVRPLAAAYKFGRKNHDKQAEEIRIEIAKEYRENLPEGLSCFSDMAFWNPAEIIGDNPKNLDYSLYREIITRGAWDIGLVSMGYRAVPKELMYRFGNKPYISVERSFEALIPAAVSDNLAYKLRSHYVEKLKEDLSAHDKIEFEISHNCFDFSLHDRLEKLESEGFSRKEVRALENALKALSVKVISTYEETLEKDLADLRQLEGVRLDIQNITKNSSDFRLLAKSVHTLLDSINQFGTPQFSRHARCAFIAKSVCRSLVAKRYISSEDFNKFFSSVSTVATDYDRDFKAVIEGSMRKEEFIRIYGHLRAGTYNICSPRYDQMEQLFPKVSYQAKKSAQKKEAIDEEIAEAIDKALKEYGIAGLTGQKVVSFIKDATEQREYFKFIFTKSLSYAIELIKKIGNAANLKVQELSYLEIPEIYAAEYYSDINRLQEFWKLIINRRHEIHRMSSEIILPAVICSEQDFSYIENINVRPNYITEAMVTAEVVILDDEDNKPIDGKIVVIEKADPGYDWIFSKGIVGLITKYGGAASHMAIRCAEFSIPAAIGSGTNLFDYVAESKKLTIDCKNEKLVRVE